ncbi:alpha/beta hydrolase [Baekduia soli]|uniref:Alpha/beta hydrolase n=1 Tax=Baekduia soli TaxID=496014 RepID=A0A5B8UDV2_9ACTN|nr:alpha/beta hydrolase [Baekduia soli]
MPVLDVDTPQGLARAHLHPVAAPVAALVLGHGAGGAVSAPDLVAATAAARAAGLAVVLVEQPYRVAGRRSAPAAPRLDEAWLAVLAALGAGPLAGLGIVVGGRSSGARVACRTAQAAGARAVLCLAFPLLPPRRAGSASPPVSRLAELEAAGVPVLVVQGERDRFGMPPEGPGRTVVTVRGDHGLKGDLPAVGAAVAAWLPGVVGAA